MAASRKIVIATHGHCFDGLASAALFTRLYERLHGERRHAFVYRTCDYGPGEGPRVDRWLTGDDNALLDFRYVPSPRLTYFFDHHKTAFRGPAELAHFALGVVPHRFYEPSYTSCTKLIADVARDHFGVDLGELSPLVAWADQIDAARFASAEEAVQRAAPELGMMTVIEHQCDDGLVTELVPLLLSRHVREVSLSPAMKARLGPLEQKRQRVLSRLKDRSSRAGVVAYCDLTDEPVEVPDKFGLYALHPGALYSITVSMSPSRVKLSIGYNPWAPAPRAHDVGEICRRHGGGGHPVVGAITLPSSALEEGKALGLALAEELNRG